MYKIKIEVFLTNALLTHLYVRVANLLTRGKRLQWPHHFTKRGGLGLGLYLELGLYRIPFYSGFGLDISYCNIVVKINKAKHS
jgi:hypothetical protein